jgi:hypothetical protein
LLLLRQPRPGRLGGAADGARGQADAGEAAQDVVGAVAERLQDAGQADQRPQPGAEAVGPQAVGRVEGAVALAAAGAVVVGAGVADVAVGRQPGLGPVADEPGVGLAVRADGAGALVALFFEAGKRDWTPNRLSE